MSHKHRVLVVDDEQAIRLALEELLDMEGYEVLTASNGREALDVLIRWPPKVVVLDLRMPVMDGGAFRAAQLGLGDGLDLIPIVLLSGSLHAAEHAKAMGASAHISKPFEFDEVVSTVGRLVERTC